jgi:class 3 adenylate cyclase
VTVVFADLVGSTALQEALDAESVRRVMTRFYDKMGAVVRAHGGSVEKLVGDAVVAAFGIPELHEDDAIRAVRAAAAMVSGLEDLNEEVERSWGVRLQLRAAVNTGELVVGPEGELVGDTMNTAARLEQATAEGEVLVSESTWRLVRHGLELEPVAPLNLKGKADPVRAWRLASITAADRRRTPAVEVSLVGRTRELERLRAGFDVALAERQCRLVSVMGSPGVGKTRLANEFGTQLGDLANVVEGRCEPTGEGMTFLPIAEVLRTVAGIGEADPADIVREKLGALTTRTTPIACV